MLKNSLNGTENLKLTPCLMRMKELKGLFTSLNLPFEKTSLSVVIAIKVNKKVNFLRSNSFQIHVTKELAMESKSRKRLRQPSDIL